MNVIFVFLVTLVVIVQGTGDLEKPSEIDETSSDIDEAATTYSKLDDSELTLIERSGEKVQADSILSGMETLKESPFVAMRTSDVDTPESRDDESLTEKSDTTQSNVDELGDIERSENDEKTIQPDDKQSNDSDFIGEIPNDESRSEWDVLDDLPTSSKMSQEEEDSIIPRKDSSVEDERSGLIDYETTPIIYGRTGSCCGHSRSGLNRGLTILSLPKDPVIAPVVQAVTNFPFNPFSVTSHYYKPQLQNFFKPEPTEASPFNKWIKNDYPFGSTLAPLQSVIPNEQKVLQSNDNFLKLPYPNFHTQHSPLVYGFVPAF